jgi:predicted  nucleic acid-binding Zn-ribbon protein
MNDLLKVLLEIQSIDFCNKQSDNDEARLTALRAKVPPQIMGHYDRLVARGKKGLAAVRHQTCTACHVSVPLGTVMTLRHGDDIQLCGNCGRYLYLDETPEPVVEEPKKIARGRKSRQLTPA